MSITLHDGIQTTDQHTHEPDDHKPDDHDVMYADPQLAIPGVDGYEVHRIAIKVSGAPDLDRSNPDDVHAFRDLRLGQRVRFVVEGYVVDSGNKAALTDTGQVEHVQGVKAIKVDKITTV